LAGLGTTRLWDNAARRLQQQITAIAIISRRHRQKFRISRRADISGASLRKARNPFFWGKTA